MLHERSSNLALCSREGKTALVVYKWFIFWSALEKEQKEGWGRESEQ